jgi:ribosome-binding protein aMBF1 (putative translation factor)
MSKPVPTCEMCGSPKRGARKLNYTKGDGSTGQLVVCNECALAWKTTQDEDGVWALTIDLDKI